MRKQKHEVEQRTESLFEQRFRLEYQKKLAKNDGLFFGIAVMFALYATQSMFTIQ